MKPPRDVIKQQAKNGTAAPSNHLKPGLNQVKPGVNRIVKPGVHPKISKAASAASTSTPSTSFSNKQSKYL